MVANYKQESGVEIGVGIGSDELAVAVSRYTINGLKLIKAPSTGKGKVASTEEKTEGVEVQNSMLNV